MRKTRVYGTEDSLVGHSIFRQQCGRALMNIGHNSHLGYIAGPPGSMKSTVLRYWMAAALSGKPVLTFEFDLADRKILLLDAEQPSDIFTNSVKQIFSLAGVETDERLIAHSLTDYVRPSDKQEKLFELTSKHREELGMLILDGGKNFVTNFNDTIECTRFLNNLIAISKRTGCVTIVLSHLAGKLGDQKLFGLLGTLLHDLASFGYRTQRSGKYFGLRQVKARYAPSCPLYFSYGKSHGTLEPLGFYPF